MMEPGVTADVADAPVATARIDIVSVVSVVLKSNASSVRIKLDGQSFLVRAPIESKRFHSSSSTDMPASRSEAIWVDGRPYRGDVILSKRSRASFDVINVLALEDYLRGVVPAEMPARWPLEALKAQAVAARTYALYRIEHGATLSPTVSDQVYRGMNVETDIVNFAVDATAGEILRLGDGEEAAAIPAYFHSTCGGMSERASRVWGSSSLSLRDAVWMSADSNVFVPRPDVYCAGSPFSSWRFAITKKALATILKRLTGRANLESLRVEERNESWRVSKLVASFRAAKNARGGAEQSRRIIIIAGPKLRMALGPDRLRSLLCDVRSEGDKFVFSGNGWGHGVGLCQWGARGMAEAGFGYRDILSRYYPSAELGSLCKFATNLQQIGMGSLCQFTTPFELLGCKLAK